MSLLARIGFLLLGLAIAAPPLSAQPPTAQPLTSQPGSNPAAVARPRIGLVLGGGGAKGSAHIGVLRVLEELRIPIDCVAGTSMGALVGGTFASGLSATEIEERVLAIDWTQTVGGRGQRDIRPINVKLDELAYSNPLEVGVVDGRVTAPGGFIETQAIEEQIRSLVATARFTQDFSELPIPFRAVATDMVAGDMAVLGSGDLATAMRASMAIPGAFAPVIQDGQVLADGGLMRNLPVDVARELCADVVIAVWLVTPQPEAGDVASALALVGRSLDVVIRANERTQIETLTGADVGIGVPMGEITTVDFQRTPEAIALGRAAAEASREALMRYSLSEAEYRSWRDGLDEPVMNPQTLREVRVSGLDRVTESYVASRLQSAVVGATVSPSEIGQDAEQVYALGDFERVDYRLSGPDDARVLEILPVEKSWGPDFLRLNIGASTDSAADILGIFRVDHTRTWINDRGGQWHNAVQIGGLTMLATDFYQPLDTRHRYFVQPILQIESNREDLYIDGDRVARYFVRQGFLQLDGGMNIGTRAQIRIGLRRGQHEIDLDTGLASLPEQDLMTDTSLRLGAIYDTRDSVALPTRGLFATTRYVHGDDGGSGEFDYDLIEGVVQQAFNFRGNSLTIVGGGGRKLSGDLPVTEDIELGGIRTFPGLRPGELRGTSYWYTGAIYRWQLAELQPLFNQSLYAGLRLQAGEMHERYDGVDDGTLYGIAGSVSGRTPIGPFELSLGFVDNGSRLLQFTIGRPVAEGSILDSLY